MTQDLLLFLHKQATNQQRLLNMQTAQHLKRNTLQQSQTVKLR